MPADCRALERTSQILPRFPRAFVAEYFSVGRRVAAIECVVAFDAVWRAALANVGQMLGAGQIFRCAEAGPPGLSFRGQAAVADQPGILAGQTEQARIARRARRGRARAHGRRGRGARVNLGQCGVRHPGVARARVLTSVCATTVHGGRFAVFAIQRFLVASVACVRLGCRALGARQRRRARAGIRTGHVEAGEARHARGTTASTRASRCTSGARASCVIRASGVASEPARTLL